MSKFRKLYLRFRIFLYSYRHLLSSIFVICMLSFFVYYIVDSFIFGELIINQAYNNFTERKCDKAINLYNIAYGYYSFADFSGEDKDLFMEIPYDKAVCYIHKHNLKKAVDSMFKGLVAIQNRYGVFSRENATFTRKYLISFYLDNNQIRLAENEFNNLIAIYKVIGSSSYESADMIRISGDIYYARKDYSDAISFYTNAYNIISKQHNIDYDVFKNIVDRIAIYESKEGRTDVALRIYDTSVQTLISNGKPAYEAAAILLLNQGDLYTKLENPKAAVASYEKAIDLIVKLPSTNYLKRNIKAYWLELKSLYNACGEYSKADDIDVKIARHERFPFLY